ncbi:MAG: carbohydrate kinase family protein [Thermomicrobiales bacterium]
MPVPATTPGDPDVVLSASIAYDYIMSFPGSFGDHILPEKTHVLSLSFLVDSLRRLRGGVAGNIAYNLALLGVHCSLIGAVGTDFEPYRAVFDDLGIDMTHVINVPGELTASAFMMSDLRSNQIAAFYPGASSHATEIAISEVARRARYGLVGAAAPDTMRRHAAEIAGAGSRLIYDPSQQVVALSSDDLNAGFDGAWSVIGNDYEYAMIQQKVGLSIEDLTDKVELFVITYGDQGSELRQGGHRVRVPAAKAVRVDDPTGAGDAYRAGFIKGLLLGADLDVIGRIAGLTATYAVEHKGTQEHVFTPEEFVTRFDTAFPDYAGAVEVNQLRRAAAKESSLSRS